MTLRNIFLAIGLSLILMRAKYNLVILIQKWFLFPLNKDSDLTSCGQSWFSVWGRGMSNGQGLKVPPDSFYPENGHPEQSVIPLKLSGVQRFYCDSPVSACVYT